MIMKSGVWFFYQPCRCLPTGPMSSGRRMVSITHLPGLAKSSPHSLCIFNTLAAFLHDMTICSQLATMQSVYLLKSTLASSSRLFLFSCSFFLSSSSSPDRMSSYGRSSRSTSPGMINLRNGRKMFQMWINKTTPREQPRKTSICMCKEEVLWVYVLVRFPPAPILSVSYGYEGLEVSSLQAILQQFLGCINILRDTLYTLVQHPRALVDLALNAI